MSSCGNQFIKMKPKILRGSRSRCIPISVILPNNFVGPISTCEHKETKSDITKKFKITAGILEDKYVFFPVLRIYV